MQSNLAYNKILAVLVVLMPILNIYGVGIPGLSISKVLIVLVIGLGFLLRYFTNPVYPKGYLTYFLYIMLIPQMYSMLAGTASLGDIIYKSISTLFFALTLGYGLRYIDQKYLIKVFGRVTLACSILFLVQEALFFTTGYRLLGIIPWLPMASGESIGSYIDIQSSIDRSTSVFLEPSHFARYVASYLCIKLFVDRKGFVDIPVIFYSAIILLSRSGNGYLLLGLLWIVWIFICIKRGRYIIQASLTALVVLAGFIVLQSGRYSSENQVTTAVLSRSSELSAEGEFNTSGFIRMYRGYVLYSELTPVEQVIGIGQGNLESYLKTHDVSEYAQMAYYNLDNMMYLNGMQECLVFGGIIGLVLFLFFLFRLMRNNYLLGKVLILAIILINLMSQAYNDTLVLLLLILAALLKNEYAARNNMREIK